ncbi:MAG: hypothetical protein A3H06_02040 [Candidatus Colwellbacteria bacterium RIFCSPLOWO2_12_FULL_44_13]|uniref:LysM domain-containing protein n=3 Tax=Candidatus Colwelliibacteriota TaxID=1817904 RepID=A0A1G1Z7N8_9BACT|nr:MAG: hypothetical protein A3F24_02150 [Candidatus Colwellbacteria bacterium RIFCSPHIGHO2_12_FULL_44_17]OGY60653.1 MAG: hypothetical protein A3I31_02860 [Candidatus Colwellbacteria bacterium RIFCSPLOWO2_02_FULL_44_20b]OGY61494.1 MAG: hypothetical protein A3H06_02040 [Candidatus Colwellbacteria bacterium RIFCSPLOWO2_12_FULL_44_13]
MKRQKAKYWLHFKRLDRFVKQKTVITVLLVIGVLVVNILAIQSIRPATDIKETTLLSQGVLGGIATNEINERNAPRYTEDGAAEGLRWQEGNNSGINEDFLGFTIVDKASFLNGGNPLGNVTTQKNGIMIYTVQEGDTLSKVAENFGISIETVLWANSIKKSRLIPGEEIVLLPVSGVAHEIKNGETLESIATLYKIEADEISVLNEESIFSEGETIIIPGARPRQVSPVTDLRFPDLGNYFSLPIKEGWNWKKIHYNNAVDIANVCGTAIYAAAEGVVTRVGSPSKWNEGYGGFVEIEHPIRQGVKTLYSHTRKNLVNTGDTVKKGDKIAEIGSTGNVHGPTGCHVHFEVIGAKNPFGE